DYIINVSEDDFEYNVLAYSQQVPVIVDFWADWCIPCRTLGPMLEKLANEGQGSFRLAKVDVDANQKLAMQYNVYSIPSVKAFRDGKVTSEFVGVLPEQRLREFVRSLAPSELDLALEKGSSLLKQEQWRSAEQTFRIVLDKDPDQPAALLGLSKSLLMQGESHEALGTLESFPASREFSAAQTLLPLAEAMQREGNGDPWADDPLDAAFNRSIRLVGRGNLPAALDGLMDILRENKNYRSGIARKVILAIFELLGDDNPLTRQYRQELASVLF
ncbi:MAG: thioredoxin, partial [Anaerolineales bacterium]